MAISGTKQSFRSIIANDGFTIKRPFARRRDVFEDRVRLSRQVDCHKLCKALRVKCGLNVAHKRLIPAWHVRRDFNCLVRDPKINKWPRLNRKRRQNLVNHDHLEVGSTLLRSEERAGVALDQHRSELSHLSDRRSDYTC